ncbi:hypothetical protein [Myroides sp. WP-1]|uniref:hypothetical protein n=1 Tax=Myroides sp. WP-1 TaxID=2759944 RepID=UPI0015F9606D|nr:hypothetical protein [Myroides sp. WP-1]MBB1138750.1 hypothetical protein [Myroides sp. WP-1]
MKKLFPYLLLLFIALFTSCNSDDTAVPSYKKITEEQKKLLLGNWQLVQYSGPEGESFNLFDSGVLITYSFLPEGKLKVDNQSNRFIETMRYSSGFTRTGEFTHLFDYVKQWDDQENKREKLYINSSFNSMAFDLKVTQEQLILISEEGEEFVYKRMFGGTAYPTISEEEKLAIIGQWELIYIQAFDGTSRKFTAKEVVIYDFSMYDMLVINNRSAEKKGDYFDRYIQTDILNYYYQFDFLRNNREILAVENLGQYVMHVTHEELFLYHFDGDIIKLVRIE